MKSPAKQNVGFPITTVSVLCCCPVLKQFYYDCVFLKLYEIEYFLVASPRSKIHCDNQSREAPNQMDHLRKKIFKPILKTKTS